VRNDPRAELLAVFGIFATGSGVAIIRRPFSAWWWITVFAVSAMLAVGGIGLARLRW